MFGMKSKETIKAELREELKQEELAKQEAENKAKEEAEAAARAKIEAENKAKEDAEKALRESDDPWVDIKAIVHDPEKGVQIELDWNDAFINYLKENAYTGVDDEAIIQKYLAVLTQNIVSEMDESKANEYE